MFCGQNVDSKEIYTVQTYDSFQPEFQSEEGEIIVRGHCVMKGYWNKPEETATVIDPGGWFHTGDIGRFTKGNLQIGTEETSNLSELEPFYDKRSKMYHVDYGFNLDAKIAEELSVL